MKINAAAKTDPGRLHDHNEDFFVLRRQAGLFLVADGVGGAEAGEVASKAACRAILHALQQSASTKGPSHHDAALADAIREANHALHEYAQQTPTKGGVGTTLTALWFHSDRVLFAYVGDSRIYLFRDGVLRQLSRDEKAGRYRLAASLGQEHSAHPHLGMVRLRARDRFLLCTDGLHGPVPRATLITVLDGQPDPATCCERLVDAANDAGGPDNVTALVADVVEAGPSQAWQFSRVRVDATSVRARLRRAPLWAAIGLLAVAALAAIWAVAASLPSDGDGGGAKVTGRMALLVGEANAGAKRGDRVAMAKALQDLVREAVRTGRSIVRADLGLDAEAAALYEGAAKTVWNQLHSRPQKALDELAASPEGAYVEAEIRATRERLDRVREQFFADGFSNVATTFDPLDDEIATIAMRGKGEYEREREAVRSAIENIELDASGFKAGSEARKRLGTPLNAARAALEANKFPEARKHLDDARLVLKRALMGIYD